MRGQAHPQTALFSYLSPEDRVPRDHPLRKMRILVDAVLATMDGDFAAVYSRRGRPSIPPEFLLRALLIRILYTVRSEWQLVQQIDFNLLFRWLVGLSIDDRVWDHSNFSHHRPGRTPIPQVSEHRGAPVLPGPRAHGEPQRPVRTGQSPETATSVSVKIQTI